jgi:hypothetical protein
MPTYPSSLAAAHPLAIEVAGDPFHAANFRCVDCARAIVKSLGPGINAVKLITAEGKGRVILPSKGVLAATTGQHIGVRIEDTVYDNHHPDGVSFDEWRLLYRDAGGGELQCFERPLTDFFGEIFRWREFAAFASNRFQDDEYEVE